MNLYILVEGQQTERKLYPAWLSHLSPKMKKVDAISQMTENCFFLISGEGYPRLLDVALINTLKDLNENKFISNLWVVLDADDKSVEERREQVFERVRAAGIDISHCKIDVIVQKTCIETWGLGNKIIISPNKLSAEFNEFLSYYNVQDEDPELMGKPDRHKGSIAHYHECYLRAMLKLRNATYQKKNPIALMEPAYLAQLEARVKEGRSHLPSFEYFLSLAKGL